MDALELLETRASNPKLGSPAPDDACLERIITAALRAPDHQLLRPWRIFIVRGAARHRLGDVLVEAERERHPDANAQALEKLRVKPLRAPLILVVAACPVAHPKVPEMEQLISAGAVAQNLCLGLHATGFAAIWRTGDPAYAPRVKHAFNLTPQQQIVGFIYAGTAMQPPPSVARPRFEDVAQVWQPEKLAP